MKCVICNTEQVVGSATEGPGVGRAELTVLQGQVLTAVGGTVMVGTRTVIAHSVSQTTEQLLHLVP